MRLVAAHDWDVTGAIRAGARAAFVARPGKALGPLSEKPDIVAPDLLTAAKAIVEADA
jgi:2-haloacid dehalogenase